MAEQSPFSFGQFTKVPMPDNWMVNPWQAAWEYATDAWQRNILFADALRERGNQYNEQNAAPVKHVLKYDYDVVMDGRTLKRPVNYGLVRITPPEGVEIDETKRPFVVVDPRAGHGPGIGGFKPDSELGAAMRAGHPAYLIGHVQDPVPGQTIEDVGAAEAEFLRRVISLHPEAEGKPCVIGNCQAGWAMIMLAAVEPDLVGPILAPGSPLSYWAGVKGANPMRYTGGLLGGTWLTQMTGDLGNGIFDGAHLVSNFENLNPANTLWTKQYNVWSNVDTEVPRYLDFERYWGGYVLLNAEEMLWIADELFVGNKLVKGEVETSDGTAIDMRNIKSPIIIFCSQGDNITPPQQALHWVLDLYEDVDEIRAYGQTIVYVIHESIGHLGIFVSGKVGRKEHTEFTENMDLIDLLPPGLYEGVLKPVSEVDVNPELVEGDYAATFEARTLDDIRALGELDVADEKAFETVARVSEINQGLYNTFVSPFVKSMVTEQSAKLLRDMHPARVQYAMFSDDNPFMHWVKQAADMVRAERMPVAADNPFLAAQKQFSDGMTAWLDSYRDFRDRAFENVFFGIYGSDMLQALVGLKSASGEKQRGGAARDAGHVALVQDKVHSLLERVGEGGLREAAVRALLYVAIPSGRVDERGFSALKQLHEELPAEEQTTLAEFKHRVRDQYYMLMLDEAAAMAALPGMLEQEAGGAKRVFDAVSHIVSAPGFANDESRQRLERLAAICGVDAAATGAPRLQAAAGGD